MPTQHNVTLSTTALSAPSLPKMASVPAMANVVSSAVSLGIAYRYGGFRSMMVAQQMAVAAIAMDRALGRG